MATTNDVSNGMTEPCEVCEMDTLHEVTVQLVTEGDEGKTRGTPANPTAFGNVSGVGTARVSA